MDRAGERDATEQPAASKRGKRCIQSKLSWFVNPSLNGISMSSPPSSEAAVKVIKNGSKLSERIMGDGKRKRNSRRKSLDKAFEESADSYKEEVSNSSKQGMLFKSWPGFDEDSCGSLPPAHVFEALNVNASLIDWRNWKFIEETSVNLSSNYSSENYSSPLKLDCACIKESNLDILLWHGRTGPAVGETNPSKLSIGLVSKEHLSPLLEMVRVGCNSALSSSIIANVDRRDQNELWERRLASYHQHIDCFPDCCLWTEKYRPKNTLEVCGNAELVRFLSEWLKSWHDNSCGKNSIAAEDNNGASYSNAHRMDETCGNPEKNVLLIAGPIGSGKSAAVYACAREQGYKVIEINASSLRNGSYLRQTFGEAVDSLGLTHWFVKDQVHQSGEHMLELLSDMPDVMDSKFQIDLTEAGSKFCNQMNATEKRSASCQIANKTLLLFEEVDVVFDEDRGFMSAILKLAETTKRPIILTSNDRKPVHPQILDRLEVLNFKSPACHELLYFVSMVCAFEKVHVSCNLLERIVKASLCDIRKILMLLQFWCQGPGDSDHRNQCIKVPEPLDIEAVHLALPKVISWDFRCELSEKLEEEINKTLSEVNKSSLLMGPVMQHKASSREIVDSWETYKSKTVKVQKKRKKELLRKYSFPDPKVLSPHMEKHLDSFDYSSSTSFAIQRTFGEKHGIALPLLSNDGPPAFELKPGATLAQHNCFNLSTFPNSLISQTRIETFGLDCKLENSFVSSERASISHVCDTYGVPDISCVLQSSLISEEETDMNSSFQSGAVSLNQEFVGFFSSNGSATVSNLDNGIAELSKFSENYLGTSAAVYAESIQGNDDLVDFRNDAVKHPLCHAQLMDDECSRSSFSMWSVPKYRISLSQEASSVSKTWRKLHSFRDKFNLILPTGSKEASFITSLTSKLADLISVADINYGSCNSDHCGGLGPTTPSRVDDDSNAWFENQKEMGSTFSQHGLCLYMKEFAAFGSSLGFNNTTDFCHEILASSTDSMTLCKLFACASCTNQNSSLKVMDTKLQQPYEPMERESVDELCDIVLRSVPARLSMVTRGLAFHEYLSFVKLWRR